MKAFLYLNLTSGTDTPYQNPVLGSVKKRLPEVAVLDLDASSGELVLQMALRLLVEATQIVICIKADEQFQRFGSIMPLMEQLLTANQNRLLLLQGHSARLLRMLQARPQLYFKQVLTDEDAVEAVKVYFDRKSEQ